MPMTWPSSTSGMCEATELAQVRADEPAGFADQHVGLIAMRRVPTARDDEQLGLRHLPCNGANLLERSVFVVFALHRQHRRADRTDLRFDVPAAKRGVEPDVVPAAKRGV